MVKESLLKRGEYLREELVGEIRNFCRQICATQRNLLRFSVHIRNSGTCFSNIYTQEILLI